MATATLLTIGTRVQGQIANAKGTIDTIVAGTAVRAYRLELANLNTTDEAVIVYKKISGGSSKIVWNGVLQGGATPGTGGRRVLALGDLTALDVIEAVTTTAAKVDYTGSGVTYTVA